MRAVLAIMTGALALLAQGLAAAPVCISNHSGQRLLLVVDDLAGQRRVQKTDPAGSLCLDAGPGITKASVGVFASEDAEEGCSRLTRPGQTETLIGFAEFDNCQWTVTPRGFSADGLSN